MKLKTYRTVEQVEERIAELQMLILGRIEKLDWKHAREYSAAIGKLVARKVQIQSKLVKVLPLFAKVGGGK